MTKTLIFKQNGQYGLRNIEGAVLLAPTCKKIKYLNQDRFAAQKNELWAVLDNDGNYLTKFIYKEVENFYNDRAIVELNTRFISWKLIDLNGKEIDVEYQEHIIDLNQRYQEISPTYSKDRYIARFGLVYRLLNENGRFVDGGTRYKKLKSLNENLFLTKKYGTQVVIDENHNILFEVPEKFNEIYYQMSNGMYQVTSDSGFSGYLDAQGNEVIPAIYHGGYEFSDDSDLAFVMIDDEKGGYINSKNEFIIEPIYEDGNVFTYGITGVSKEGVWFFINEKGEKISPEYSEISDFINGYASVTLLDGAKAIVDSKCDIAFKYPEDTEIGYFVNELAPITQDGKVGLINSVGEILIKPEYEEISVSEFTDVHIFKKHGLYGYISTNGEVIHEAIFNKADHFGEKGDTIVEKDGISFLIRDFGKRVAELTIDKSNQFSSSEFGKSDVASVKLDDDHYGYMNTDGKLVGKIYEHTSAFYNGQAIATIPAQYQIIDKNGQVVNTENFDITIEDGELILETKE